MSLVRRATTTARPTFAYVGWSGHANLGDDAIRDALARALPDAAFEDVPLYPRAAAGALLGGHLGRLRSATPLLGGGTAIGRTNWRVHLRTAQLLARGRPGLMIGAGVEDPCFTGRHSFGGWAELRRWGPLLGSFAAVTVRGPRSRDVLAAVGVPARIVGDPALLLEPPPVPRLVPRLLGVNLGYGDDLWGHDHDAVVASVAAVVREVARRGWATRFLVANPGDRRHVDACLRLARVPSVEIVDAVDSATYLDRVAPCEVLIGERLHAVVLASLAGVPSVMLEYQPKCLDFMASVGRAAWSIRTDAADPATLLDHVEALAAARPQHAAAITRAVYALRALLDAELGRIRACVGLAAEPAGGAPPWQAAGRS